MQKILPRLRLFTVCAAILGTAAAYLRLRKVWEAKRSHEQQPEFPIPQEHREAEMADQDSLHKDESAIKSNRTEISSEEPKRKRILRPRISLWTFFALLGVVLAAFGFTLLPPSTASLGFPHEELPVISVWTSQPVPMVIILDASRDGFDPMLEVFADTPPGGIKWDITSSVDDLWNGDSTSAPSNQVTGTAKGSTGYFSQLNSGQVQNMGEVDSLASNNEMTASAYVQMDASLFSQAGSKTRIAFPEITESEYPPSTSTTESPTGKWYGPLVDPAYLSKLIVRAPEEVLFDRTDAVTPDFTSKGLWETTTPSLSVYWNGTDLAEESDEQQNLFFAGLLFGIAGPAFIAAAQEFSSKRKERAKRSIEAEGGGDEGG